ncbi:unnamed protein product [Urochloa humidicola]
MEPPPAGDSRRRGGGRGGKPRVGKQLGLKRPAAPAPSPSSGSPSPPLPPPPPPMSASDATSSSPAVPNPSPAAASSSPAAPMFNMPPRPPQGGGWGGMPPSFPLSGDQQGPNSRLYPPGGFYNFIQQNSHLVGQRMSFNPMSPPAPQATKEGTANNNIVNIDSDEAEISDANRTRRQIRYWTHEEEERLASAWLNASKDPIHGNDKKGDTFWKEVTDMFNTKGEGKRTR